MKVMLGLELTADEPMNIEDKFETMIAWAIPSKGSVAGEYTLYEGGVL